MTILCSEMPVAAVEQNMVARSSQQADDDPECRDVLRNEKIYFSVIEHCIDMTSFTQFRNVLPTFCRKQCMVLISSRTSSSKSSCVNGSDNRPPDPSEITNDMIGPPNQLSNLRPVIFHVPKNESSIEQEFRLEREKVQKWNEEFWIKHNSAFVKGSSEFRTKKLESSADSEKKSLTAEEMSEFYKAFLDKNWRTHVSYNFEWYRKNFNLVYLAFRVHLSKLISGK